MELKPEYRIFYSKEDRAYVAITSEFKRFSGISTSPVKAMRELMVAVKAGREIIKEDSNGA